MDRRAFLLSALGAAGAVALGSCVDDDDDPSSGTTTLLGPDDDPSSLEPVSRPTLRLPGGDFGFPSPFVYFVGPGYFRMSYIYDTLLLVDATGELVPWLSSRYERSSDGLTYTFELRDDVRWHDGRPLTADDVVFTFDYFAAQTLPPFVIARPQDIASVKKTDERAVAFTLDKPAVTFAEVVGSRVPIVPQHIWSSIDAAASAQDPEVLVGTGPYRLESYSSGDGAYLYGANNRFFLGRPFVKRLELRPVGDELNALLAGELDAGGPDVTGAAPAALAPFRDDPTFGVLEGPLDFAVALYWNQEKGGALADRRFRRACALAINRADIVDRLLGGQGEPGNPGFLPPDHPFHVDVEQYPFDRDAANRLLEDAGYVRSGGDGPRRDRAGRALRFPLLVNADASAVVDLVVADLEAVGVELEVESADFGAATGTMTGGGYEMAITLYGNVSGDPNYMRTLYSSTTGQKFFHSARGYADPELDRLADEQLVAFDDDDDDDGKAKRRRLLARMQEIVARDVPFLHLYYPRPFLVFRKAAFDQWSYTPNAGFYGSPMNKRVLVTGLDEGVEIRPTKG